MRKYTRRPLADRFWAKVNKNGPVPQHRPELGPCWLWTGATNPHGYGKIWVDGTWKDAHVVARFLETGVWPVEQTLHHCDTPGCVRHLFEGTQTENMRDCRAKGRALIGARNAMAKLDDDRIREIRAASSTQAATARRFGVSQSLVSLIRRRERWAHVQ